MNIGTEYRPIKAEDLKEFKISFSVSDERKTAVEMDIEIFEKDFAIKEVRTKKK